LKYALVFACFSVLHWRSINFANQSLHLLSRCSWVFDNEETACLLDAKTWAYTHSRCDYEQMHDHWSLFVRVDLSRLRSCCSWSFASNFFNNLCALLNSLLSNHVSFQRTLYFVSNSIALFSRIFVISHFCFFISAESSEFWCCSMTSDLMTIVLTNLTMTDVLSLWTFAWTDRLSWFSNEVMLEENRRSKDSAIALELEQWCVVDSFVEQSALSWVSAVSISDIMLAISAKVLLSSVLMFSFCITNELSVKCQTSFYSCIKDSRSVLSWLSLSSLDRFELAIFLWSWSAQL